MKIKNIICLFVFFIVFLFLLVPAHAMTLEEAEFSLIEGDFFEPAEGYYFDILDVDPLYGEAQFSITKYGEEVLNWVYYEGSYFYYDDAYLTLSFDVVDIVSETGTDYVIVSNFYLYDKTSTTGTIAVSSEPSEATVYLNGNYKGETGFDPLWIYDVQEGYHEIELVKDGYYSVIDTIYVYAGETNYYSNSLEPMAGTAGTIAVSSEPSGVTVYLNGHYQGETGFDPLWIYDVREGYHEIELVKDGYYSVIDTIYVYAGETNYYSNSLETMTGTAGIIAVSSEPSEATVYLNGYYQGETGFDPLWIYDVQEGYHEIELVKDGYYSVIDTIYVYAGETNYYSNTLEPMNPWDELLYMILGLIIMAIFVIVPLLFIVWLLSRRKKPKETAVKTSKDLAAQKSEQQAARQNLIPVKSAFEYKGAIIHYKVKIENHSKEPVGDIKIMIFVPDVFLLKEKEKSISMLEPGEGKTVTFELRPTGECGDCMVSGSIDFYDYGTKKRSHVDMENKLISIVCPVLTRKEIDEDAWRKAISEMIIAEEDSKDLGIPAENLFDMATRVLKDMNLYMIKPEITSTPQLFTGVARFYAEGVAGLRYAAYVEVVGKRKSRLIMKAWAENEESLTGFYHKMLEEIEKRTDIKIFVDEGIYQYHISTTTIKDSVVQRSKIDAGAGPKKRRCPKCDREVEEDEKFCMECGEKLE